MTIATASDHCKRRYTLILPMLLISAVGEVILLNTHDDTNARYGALFLVVVGGHTAASNVICWFSANREPTSIPSNYIV